MEFTRTESLRVYTESSPLLLECGQSLAPVSVAYETYGRLNPDGANAILVCHALTGSAHAAGRHSESEARGWWDGLIGPGRALDTRHYFVVCANILGSCYGTTGPSSGNPWNDGAYGSAFPVITVRDMVRVQKKLLDALHVKRLATVIGSSLGGMQVLEWGLMYPDFCETMIPISVAARQPAMCIALNSAARAAIRLDPVEGLAAARMIGMISYRTAGEFEERFGRQKQHAFLNHFDPNNLFEVESYLQHQGRKLAERFDAETYLCLSRAMDLHDICRGRGDLRDTLQAVSARAFVLGVSSDTRYPVAHQKELARHIPGALYAEIESNHGHDAFLIEYEQLTELLIPFLQESESLGYRKVSGWR